MGSALRKPEIEVPRGVPAAARARYRQLAAAEGSEAAETFARGFRGDVEAPAPGPRFVEAAGPLAWSEERVETLRRMWLAGRSADAIATELGGGATRCGVLGKIHRLGLSRRGGTVAARQATRAAAEVKTEPRTAKEAPAVAVAAKPKVAAVAKEQGPLVAPKVGPALALRPSGGVAFFDLSRIHCRYVVGGGEGIDALHCGGAVERGSYCRAHAPLIYAGRVQVERSILDRVNGGKRG